MSNKKAEVQASPEELQCGICYKGYRDPRHLNCLHSFCFECLNTYVTKREWKKTLLCPLCQKEMILPKTGVAGIEQDFFIRARQEVDNLTITSECEKCVEKEFAKCRCLECQLNLCKTCKTTHSESESDTVHHFLEFVEAARDTNRESPAVTPGPAKITQPTTCRTHSNDEMKIFCVKCKTAICATCKEEKHKTHPIQDMKDVAKVMKDSLTPFLASIKEYLPEFEDYARKVRNSQKELDNDLENAIQEIKSRSKFLQREIEKIGQKLISEVKERHNKESEVIDGDVKQVIKAYQSMANTASSADRIMKIGSDLNIIETSGRIQRRFLSVEDDLPKLTREKIETVGFVPGGLKTQNLQSIFGQCSKGEIELPTLPIPWGIRVAKEFEMRSLASFKIKEEPDTVQAIAPVSENEAWVCCGWGSQEVHLYTRDGERKKTVDVGMQVDHLCVTQKGEILVSSYEDKYIKKINKNFEICDFAMPHLYPGGMVVNKRNELYVCAVDSYTTRRSPHSTRVILKMSEYGMNLDEIDEYNDVGLFGAPYRIAEASNKDLCITDREETKLRVTVIDHDGMIRFTYLGPSEIQLKQPFNPLGLCVDSYGNLLVSDWGNHCVHLLNRDGIFQGFMLSKKDGIFKPNALALDKSGNLWVGDGNSSVRVYKYGKRRSE